MKQVKRIKSENQNYGTNIVNNIYSIPYKLTIFSRLL